MRLTYKLEKPIDTKYLHYDYMVIADYDISRGNYGRITDSEIYNKLGSLEDIEDELGIDLVALLNAKTIYIAEFHYWKWDIDCIGCRIKRQCKKDDVGAVEEKRIYKKNMFCVDFINKEIVIIENRLVSDFDYETEITRFLFSEYGKTWALTKEELL